MAKRKQKFYEEMEFDDIQYAVDVFNDCKRKLKKVERGLFVSIIATAYNLIIYFVGSQGILDKDIASFLSIFISVGSIISYVLGGGILTALRWAWRIGTFMWYIFVFPLDLMMVLLGFGFSMAGFFLAPVIFVYMNYRQIKEDYKAAQKYISYYKIKTQSTQTKVSNSQKRVETNRSRSYGSTTRTQTSDSGASTSRVRINSDGTRSYR